MFVQIFQDYQVQENLLKFQLKKHPKIEQVLMVLKNIYYKDQHLNNKINIKKIDKRKERKKKEKYIFLQ